MNSREKNRFLTASFDITSCFCSTVVIRKYKLLPYLYKFVVPTFIIKQNPITKTEEKKHKKQKQESSQEKKCICWKTKTYDVTDVLYV